MRLHVTLALLLIAGCRAPVWTAASPSGQTIEVRQAAGKTCVRGTPKNSRTCFDAVAVHTMAFDRSGGHVAYAVRQGSRWRIVRDDEPGPQWSAVGAPRWSPDGHMLAYPAEREGRWHVVVNDVVGPAFDAILEKSVTFGRGRAGYAATRRDSVYAVIGDRVSRGWSGAAHLTFDPTGLVAAYAARDHAGWHAVTGDSVTGVHDEIRALALSPDAQLAYVASDSSRVRVVAPDKEDRVYEDVSDLQWSRDGRLLYLASVGDSSFIVRDDTIIERGARGDISDVTVSASGRVAWVATLDNRMSVGDRAHRDTFDLVVERSLQFVDGERLACLAGNRATRELFVVVDGRRTGEPLEWTELVRWARHPDGEGALRAWVAVVARSR